MTAATFHVGQPPRAGVRVAVPRHPHRRPSFGRRLLTTALDRVRLAHFVWTVASVWLSGFVGGFILGADIRLTLVCGFAAGTHAAFAVLLWRRP